MDETLLSKIAACAILFFSALVFALLPLKARRWLLNSTVISDKIARAILSASICFGAGILLATTFLHILGEIRERFQQLQTNEQIEETEYPLAELVLCCGFFLIYLLEEIVHYAMERQKSGKCNDHIRFKKRNNLDLSSKIICVDECPFLKKNGHASIPLKSATDTSDSSESSAVSHEAPPLNSSHNHYKEVDSLRSVMTIIALSFHGCFEGLSLGLADGKEEVWLLCLALSTHKIFIGFSIGMELLEVGISRTSYVIQILIFSAASPLGAILGATLVHVTDTGSGGVLFLTIFEGFSGGTILYVVFCEILERERMNRTNKAVKFATLLIGFWVMAALQAIHIGSHSPEGGGECLNNSHSELH